MRHASTLGLILLLAAVISTQTTAQEPRPVDMTAAPAPVTAAVARADLAIGELQGTLDFCVTCHGPRETVDTAIGSVLETAYPQDRAVGFAPGDLRGWVWAEVTLTEREHRAGRSAREN